jgi:hypothetical protein
MMDSAATSGPSGVFVELLLSGYRVVGESDQVTEKLRFSDVLAQVSETLTLKRVSILTISGHTMAALPEVSVAKRQIFAAIPRETDAVLHQQRLFRAGMLKPPATSVSVLALLPPYAVVGQAHLPPATGVSDPAYSALPRFSPLTEAVVFREEERLHKGPIVLISRDHLAVLGRTAQETSRQRPGTAEGPTMTSGLLSDLMSALSEGTRR